MKHIMALLIKFIMISAILGILLGIYTYLTFVQILYLAAATTIFTYLFGDMLILASTNNLTASIADFGLSVVVIYMFNYLWNTPVKNSNPITISVALLCAIVIGIAEAFFHIYVERNVLPGQRSIYGK